MTEQQKYINKIKKVVGKYHPFAVYLFGSRVKGKAKSDSDFDLLIVTENNENPQEMCTKIGLDLFPREYSLDLLAYSKKQLDQLGKTSSFVKDIQKKGKLIYGKGN